MRKEINISYELIRYADLSEEELLLEKHAIKAAKSAYAPYSKFNVGVAVLLENGEIISASNQENAAYPSGLCAERTALFYAGAKYPEVAPIKLLILAFNDEGRVDMIPPCGACRQVMMETATRFAPFEVILSGKEEIFKIQDCRSLLPFAFDKSKL